MNLTEAAAAIRERQLTATTNATEMGTDELHYVNWPLVLQLRTIELLEELILTIEGQQ